MRLFTVFRINPSSVSFDHRTSLVLSRSQDIAVIAILLLVVERWHQSRGRNGIASAVVASDATKFRKPEPALQPISITLFVLDGSFVSKKTGTFTLEHHRSCLPGRPPSNRYRRQNDNVSDDNANDKTGLPPPWESRIIRKAPGASPAATRRAPARPAGHRTSPLGPTSADRNRNPSRSRR